MVEFSAHDWNRTTISTATESSKLIFEFMWYTLFHKQHFYMQHEAQNGQSLAKFKQNPEAQFLVLVIEP